MRRTVKKSTEEMEIETEKRQNNIRRKETIRMQSEENSGYGGKNHEKSNTD